MITYDKTRHNAAKKDMSEAGLHADRCRGAGVAAGLAARIVSRDHPSVLTIDSESHLVPAGGISLGGSGIVFAIADDHVVTMAFDALTTWGRSNGTNGSSFSFEWTGPDGREHDVALVSRWRDGDSGYAIAVECAVIQAMSETEDRWCVSDLARGLGGSREPIRMEPARLPDEVPGDDHELVWSGGRLRIGDVCALELVHEDCYQEYHLVTTDGRYLRFVFGEFDR